MDQKQVPLFNALDGDGKYMLVWRDKNNEVQRVDGVGYAMRPFVLIASVARRGCAVVLKKGTSQNQKVNRLYLINLHTGTLVDGSEYGASRVLFNSGNGDLFFTPLAADGRAAQTYSWCLPQVGTPYQAINVPCVFQPGIVAIDTRTKTPATVELSVVDFVPRKKRISRKKVGLGRVGRKMPSSKKQMIQPQVQPQAGSVSLIKRNRVALRRVGQSVKNKFYYDVYINGQRVASRRLDARAQTLMRDRILIVQYKNIDSSGMGYDVFLPDATPWRAATCNRDTATSVAINNVVPIYDGVRLGLDNNTCHVIRDADLVRFGLQQFVLDNQKVK